MNVVREYGPSLTCCPEVADGFRYYIRLCLLINAAWLLLLIVIDKKYCIVDTPVPIGNAWSVYYTQYL